MSDSNYESVERLREQVIEQLSTGYSNDFLSEIEFEERVEQATSAKTHQELRSLIVDLPVAGSPNAPVPAGRSMNLPVNINDGEVDEESSVIAVLSGSERRGVWYPPKVLHAIAFLGGVDIDLRDAKIPASGMKINAIACLGGVDITVPEHANVVINGIGILGGFEGKTDRAAGPGAGPTITIDGVAFLGGVEAKTKRSKRKQ
jgi:hypothetical protein